MKIRKNYEANFCCTYGAYMEHLSYTLAILNFTIWSRNIIHIIIRAIYGVIVDSVIIRSKTCSWKHTSEEVFINRDRLLTMSMVKRD